MTGHRFIKCAICGRSSTHSHPCFDYATILHSMGIIEAKYAHNRCVLKIQQQALTLRSRISGWT